MPHLLFILSFLLSTCGVYEGHEVNSSNFATGKEGQGPQLTVIGDSQSTGVLASTEMGHAPPEQLLSNLLPFFYSNNPSLANLQEHFSEYRNAAVATDEDWGLRAIIATLHHLEAKDIPLYLAAQWGGKVRHLPDLLEKLHATFALNDISPAYVLVMLGANDLCTGEPSSQFEGNFAHGLQLVAAAFPQSQLIVAAIPPIPQMREYDHNYHATFTCEQVRIRFCPALFADDFSQQYVEYNASIERVVKFLREEKQLPLIFADKFRGMFFKKNMLAFDCFHPNRTAQKRYAEYFKQALLEN